MSNYQKFSVLDYFKIFLDRRKIILSLTFASTVITALVVFFIMDPIYLSVGSVKTAVKSQGIGGLLSGAGLPDLGEIGDLAGASSGAKELALYESIILSRKNIEEVILKFKLNDEWEFKYMNDAIKYFRESILELKKDKVSGIIEIGIYDKNPRRAKEIVEFIITQLNRINSELNVLNAKNNREFIQSRYENIKSDLQKAEDSLKVFQDKYGISPDLQVKAAVQSEIQLEAEIKSEEVKLDILKKLLSPDEAEIKMQVEKINSLKTQLDLLNNSQDNSSSLTLKGKPEIVLNFLRIQRNVEIQNKILTYIIPIFEQAKIEEKKNTPSVLIFDQPDLPEKKAKPKRLVIILIVTGLVFFLSFSFFIIVSKWKYYRTNLK